MDVEGKIRLILSGQVTFFQCSFTGRSDTVPLMLTSWFIRDCQFN